MKYIITALLLLVASVATAAQTTIQSITSTTGPADLRTKVNTQLSNAQSNFTELYNGKADSSCFASESAFNACFDLTWSSGSGDDLGSAAYSDVVALWTTCTGYLKSDGTCDTPSGSATYPGSAGLANWTGSAWGTSQTLGTGVGSFLSTPSGANLASALTSALPVSKGGTGLTSLGTGVATAMGNPVNGTGGLATWDGLPAITWGTGLTNTANTITVTYPVTAEAFSGSGWNADTAGLTRNDAYDYVHQFDSNDNGKVDTIDSGASPTVDAAGEVAVDTTSDQLIYYGGAKRVLTYKKQIDFVVKSPADADDFLLFKAQTAITITDIHVIAQGGTSISVDIQECDSAGANCATVDTAITADTDGAEDDGTLSNATIDSGDWVKVVLGAPSGTVNFVSGSIYYVETAN